MTFNMNFLHFPCINERKPVFKLDEINRENQSKLYSTKSSTLLDKQTSKDATDLTTYQ